MPFTVISRVLILRSDSSHRLTSLFSVFLCLSDDVILNLIRCYQFSSSVVSSAFLLGWWMITRPHFHVDCFLLSLGDFSILARCSLKAVAVITLRFSSCWVTLWPAVLATARIRPNVSRQLEISFGLRGLSPGLLSPSGGCCLAPEAPLIRGMPMGPKVFLAMPGACGLRPCNQTHRKRPCTFGGAYNKYGSLKGESVRTRWSIQPLGYFSLYF